MLETRALQKVYKPKKGVPVVALKEVSLKFPETGMVFLLGKSGSGKSTLLNLLGGLDKYDGGEIIIKGVSSKDFSQQSFDSYRNTYVGFIFQEYNILEEFSVGANIALALELQGRKATDEEINKILKEVDLEGYGNRKPNELSGGQKQRVAIARALVKNPEIIMADEPTGALDSNTGKQVFDTLKKLSKEKLVIIVSHDREFSEKYADRIIELADGSVISDVSLANDYDFDFSRNTYDNETKENLVFTGNTIELASGYHLTEEDRIAINKYIDDLNTGKINIEIATKQAENKRFVDTKQDEICNDLNGKPFKLIKSKLPLKNAFKIGASALKYKKFRLVMTILLSFVAFTLFGLADTLGSYNHINACTNSLFDNKVDYLSLVKAKKMTYGIEEYYEDYGYYFSKEEMANISKMLGIEFTGVYSNDGQMLTFYNRGTKNELESMYDIYLDVFSGFAEIDNQSLDALGYKLLAGKLPDGNKNEVAISKLAYESFAVYKYTDRTLDEDGEYILTDINKYEDLIGKKLNVNGIDYEITGIVDTNFNFDRYKQLMEKNDHMTETEQIAMYALYNEYNYEAHMSLTGALMTGKGFVDKYMEEFPRVYSINDTYVYLWSDTDFYLDPSCVTTFDKIHKEDVIWVDGEKTELADNEIIITLDCLLDRMEGVEFGVNGEIKVPDTLYEKIKEMVLYGEIYSFMDDVSTNLSDVKIVGILPMSLKRDDVNRYSYGLMVTNEKIASKCVKDMTGLYQYIVGAMPEDKDEIRSVVEKTIGSEADMKYIIQNSVTYDLDMLNVIIKAVAKVAFYVGIGFAVFASLMLANFIGISISHKKQEIGILRAIGARSNDVFTIFFSESFVIAAVNFILAAIATLSVTNMVNNLINEEIGLLVTVLDFGPRQLLLLFGVSIGVAALASFLPVMKIAAKKPIDAIRKR